MKHVGGHMKSFLKNCRNLLNRSGRDFGKKDGEVSFFVSYREVSKEPTNVAVCSDVGAYEVSREMNKSLTGEYYDVMSGATPLDGIVRDYFGKSFTHFYASNDSSVCLDENRYILLQDRHKQMKIGVTKKHQLENIMRLFCN